MGTRGSRRRLVLATGVAFVLAACGQNGSTTPSAKQTGPLNVGVVAPFTGDAAELGALSTPPCTVATKLINAAGGVLGHTLNCVAIDDTGDPADAVPNLTRALATTSNLDMVVGLESNTAATTIPLVNKARIPMFTANGLAAFGKTTDQYYWRATASDDAAGAAFVVWANQKGFKRSAIVFQNNIGSEGNLPGVMAATKKLGGNVVLNVTIPGDAASYSSVVERVIAAKPDVIVFSADPQTAATFLSQYKQLNSGTIPPMVTATDSLTPDFWGAVTKAIGTQYVTQSIFLVGSVFDNTGPAFQTYQGGIVGSQTKDVSDTILSIEQPAASYDGINVMALAMMEANSTIGSDYNPFVLKVASKSSGAVVVHDFADGKRALQAGKTIQYVGVVGEMKFNKYHNFSGDFAANVFTPDGGSSQVGTITGDTVGKLLAG
jgi:branched-chain amino acid transport system substrate-binding protein